MSRPWSSSQRIFSPVTKPWSPDYVSKQERAVERAVARLLEDKSYEVEFPEGSRSRWDFRCRSLAHQPPPKKRPWIYVEVKGRVNIEWDERVIHGKLKDIPVKGPFITKSKADELVRISGEQEAVRYNHGTEGPVWVVVVANDGVARFAWLNAAKLATFTIDMKDTNKLVRQRGGARGDAKDHGIAKYIVPFELFHPLGRVV